MAIKAFVFDCGGVLLRNADLSVYERWEQRLGLTSGELAKRLWYGEPWTLAECGHLTDAQFWAAIGALLGIEDGDLQALYDDLWNTYVVDERVLALVERARVDHKVAILSNATDGLEDLLTRRYGIADRFHAIVNSARVGIAKPQPGIYEEMLRRLDVTARETVFVDDRAENVAAAAALGMHVAWFVHPVELERQLECYLRPLGGDTASPSCDSSAEPPADEQVPPGDAF
ncbi:MAG: HAD family hydrolase [Anaerolineae bacterium]